MKPAAQPTSRQAARRGLILRLHDCIDDARIGSALAHAQRAIGQIVRVADPAADEVVIAKMIGQVRFGRADIGELVGTMVADQHVDAVRHEQAATGVMTDRTGNQRGTPLQQ
ncbi:MAG: hypothetical protein R3E68_00825 [Burkholderiaceae bacterium]